MLCVVDCKNLCVYPVPHPLWSVGSARRIGWPGREGAWQMDWLSANHDPTLAWSISWLDGQWNTRDVVLVRSRADCLGAFCEGVTPVPIPNTAVKPFSADGTRGATHVGE